MGGQPPRGVVATAGDRRDEDMRELGRVAARYFDEVIVREDAKPRGRVKGETAALIMEGVEDAVAAGGARAGSVEIVLDEMEASRRALDRARPGDLVVLCVDHATEVFRELEARRGSASPNGLAPRRADPWKRSVETPISWTSEKLLT